MTQQQINSQLPPEVTLDVNMEYELDIQAQDYFYFLPTSADEEWEAMRIDVEMDLTIDTQSNSPTIPPMSQAITIYLTMVETGTVTGTETVETPAGTFEECLKIEYRLESTMETSPPMADAHSMFKNIYGESLTTLWLAPNVGIVKFAHEPPGPGTEKTLELTQYEIKSSGSEDE